MSDWIPLIIIDHTETLWSLVAQATADLPDAAGGVAEPTIPTDAAAPANAPAAGEGGAGGGAAAPGFTDLFRSPVFFIGSMFALFYLFVLAPERRKQRETERKRAALKKNDRVLTTSGIFATVVTVHPESEELTVRIDESNNTKIRILRSSVATVIGGEKDGATT